MKSLPFSLLSPLFPSRSRAWLGLAFAAAVSCTGCGEKHVVLPAAHAAPSVSATAAPVAVARGKIDVPGGLLDLSPAQDGLVTEVAVQEGQNVKRGDLLLRLSSDAVASDQSVADSELKLALAKLEARRQRMPALERTAARLTEAVAAGAAEPQRADEAAQAVGDAKAELLISQAEAGVARSKLAQLQVVRSHLELRAPQDGMVIRVAAHVGQRAPAASAITLLPHRALVVRAELNESYADRVRVGQRADVFTDGDATATALPSAHVVRISPVLGTGRLQDDLQRGPVRVVECVLEFDQPPKVRVGQNVRVNFYGDK